MKRCAFVQMLLLVIAATSFAQEPNVGGLRLGMSTAEMAGVIQPDGFGPPTCHRYDSYYACVTFCQPDGRMLSFELSAEDKTLKSATLFFSVNRLAEIKQDTTRHFGKPNINGSKFVWLVGGAIPARLELYNVRGKTVLSLSER